MKSWLTFALAVSALAVSGRAATPAPDATDIVRRSVQKIQADWKRAPEYAYTERDVISKRHSAPATKTYEVLMIDGSPYNRLTAIDDHPLSAGERAEEESKLKAEILRRGHESERDRRKRIAKYLKERQQNHAMLKEMVDAFDFQLNGEQQVDGHDCWLLNAVPKPGYQPTSRETRVLLGMKGTLWVDKSQYQWVKVEAEVMRPVSLYGFLAKVGPGTRFMLEQEPVQGNLWLPKHFSMKVNASALGFINENSSDDETYRDYKPMPNLGALEAAK